MLGKVGRLMPLALLSLTISDARADCADRGSALGVSRIVEIDTTNGPLYGEISVLQREESFLEPKEIVLTFDDGPIPRITKSILDTLDLFCTKATFFPVGRMALAYPASVRDILGRGHTLGAHTWSHPLNLKRLSLAKATDQIERGFAAVTLAAGHPISPFFRFPGLSDSNPMMAHLQERGIAAFTVDVVSNDSYISSPTRLADYTVREIEKRQGGIVLFHDIKASTAKALPTILASLRERGYRVVHMRAKAPFQPLESFNKDLEPLLAAATKGVKTSPGKETPSSEATDHLLPALVAPPPLKSLSGEPLDVAIVTPPLRERLPAEASHSPDDAQSAASDSTDDAPPRKQRRTRPKRQTEAESTGFDFFAF